MTSVFDALIGKLNGQNMRGQVFFDQAIEVLSAAVNRSFSGIAELADDGRSVNILAAMNRGGEINTWRYNLEGTPCCNVYLGTINEPRVFIGDNLTERFPDDEFLRTRGLVSYCGEVFFDDHGHPVGHVFIMDDQPLDKDDPSLWYFRLIAQRIGAEYNRWKMEQKFAVQQERYKRATTAGRVGVWEWDLLTDAVYFAPNLEAMLGCSAGEHIRHIDDWLAFTDPASRQTMHNEADEYRSGHRTGESVLEYSVQTADGRRRWFEARARPITNADGKVITLIGTDTDITDRKKTEADLIEAKLMAEKANRSKSQFLATMSHEFRTPLNAIIGFSDMMRVPTFRPADPEVYKSYANDILSSGHHMLSLVNDVLDLAAIEAGKRSTNKSALSVQAILSDGVKTADRLSEDRAIEFVTDISEPSLVIYADERAIVQIINNLLSNAVKFTPDGGRVHLTARAQDSGVIITVEDTGVGIPAEKLDAITEPFLQAHSNPHLAAQGTGLGLAIVKSLLDSHDGDLIIESELDKGTVVSIFLPH